MKKFIINILYFFAIVVVIDLCVGNVGDYFQSHAKGGATKLLNDLVKNDRHDILIMGSSRAHHHYDTPYLSDTLGLDVYNAGYDGNGVVLAYGLLGMILEQYQPQLVLYDIEPLFDIYVYEGDNNHKRYISTLKPYYKDDAVSPVVKDVSKEEWYKNHSSMIRYNTEILPMVIDNIQARAMLDRGYVPLTGVFNYDMEKKNANREQVDDFKLKYLEKLIQLAQSKKVKFAVVASPKYGSQSSVSLKPAFDICQKYDVPILDYYTSPLFMQHKEWFKEMMHLNAKGAREYSKILAGDIKVLLEKKAH